MPNGFQLFNGSDIVIDGEFRNYQFWASGSSTAQGVKVVSFPTIPAGDTPQFAIYSPDTYAIFIGFVRDASGNYIGAHYFTDDDPFYTTHPNPDYPANPYTEWRVYAPYQGTASGSSFGLQVFDANGNKAFDSSVAPLAIQQYISFSSPPISAYSPGSTTVTHVGCTKPFIIQNFAGQAEENYLDYQVRYWGIYRPAHKNVAGGYSFICKWQWMGIWDSSRGYYTNRAIQFNLHAEQDRWATIYTPSTQSALIIEGA